MKRIHFTCAIVCVLCVSVVNIILMSLQAMEHSATRQYQLSLPTPNRTLFHLAKKELKICGLYKTYGYTEFAYVSMISEEGSEAKNSLQLYMKSAAKLGVSIKQWTNLDMVMMVVGSNNLSQEYQNTLSQSGWILCYVKSIENPNSGANNRFLSAKMYSKLNAWSLIEYKAVAMLDIDMIFLRDPVLLFTDIYQLMSQSSYPVAAVEDVPKTPTPMCNYSASKYNAGMLLFEPNATVFSLMKDAIHTLPHPPEYAEQAFLNEYFKDQVYPVKYSYNVNLAGPLCEPDLWNREYENFTLIHYTVIKPWMHYESYMNWMLESNAWRNPVYFYLLWEWTPISSSHSFLYDGSSK